MPNKKPKSDKKNSKQPKSLELTEEHASSVRGGADGSVRAMDPTNALPAVQFNPKEFKLADKATWSVKK